MRARLLLPAALLAAACGGEKAATTDTTAAMNPPAATGTGMAGDTGAMAGGAMAGGATAGGTGAGGSASLSDPSTVAQLDSVATAARSGLTSLPASVAVPLLQSFETKLRGANDPALTSIAGDLEALRGELGEGTVDGGGVGEILRRLGPKVTDVASRGGAAQSTLQNIGTQLTQAGNSLRR